MTARFTIGPNSIPTDTLAEPALHTSSATLTPLVVIFCPQTLSLQGSAPADGNPPVLTLLFPNVYNLATQKNCTGIPCQTLALVRTSRSPHSTAVLRSPESKWLLPQAHAPHNPRQPCRPARKRRGHASLAPANRQQLLRGTIDVKRGESVLRAHDTIVDFAFLGP